MSQHCIAGCCPHDGNESILPAANDRAGPGCPPDVPQVSLPERVAHLYACQGLSTYRIADVVGVSRQVVTRLLHRAQVPVKPRGSGRRRLPRGAGAKVTDALLADLYLRRRFTCAQISELTSIPIAVPAALAHRPSRG